MDAVTFTVTIPTVTGVQYSKTGTGTVANGATFVIPPSSSATFTAAARAGSELAAGATVSWTVTRA